MNRTMKEFAWTCFAVALPVALGVLIFSLISCTPADTKDPGTMTNLFTVLGAAASAIPGIGPVAGPLIASIGPAIGALTTSHAAALAAGGLVNHHINFGVTPGRRRKLAAKRDAHRAAAKLA